MSPFTEAVTTNAYNPVFSNSQIMVLTVKDVSKAFVLI
jgi:hypothetical protein